MLAASKCGQFLPYPAAGQVFSCMRPHVFLPEARSSSEECGQESRVWFVYMRVSRHDADAPPSGHIIMCRSLHHSSAGSSRSICRWSSIWGSGISSSTPEAQSSRLQDVIRCRCWGSVGRDGFQHIINLYTYTCMAFGLGELV